MTQEEITESRDFISILSDQRDTYDDALDNAQKVSDLLIGFYELDPEDPETAARYTAIVRELKTRQFALAKDSTVLFEKEKEIQHLCQAFETDIEKLNAQSFKQISKTAEMRFDNDTRGEEIQRLENTLGTIEPLVLDDEVKLDLELSKDEVMKILQIEKKKRVLLNFENSHLLEPEMRTSRLKYERLAAKDKELKEFLYDKVKAMNVKVQAAKKAEGL